ncbi:MAG TPA: hypothetical protein VK464_19960 [Symbiobacteriaceae bacterium]|nr:hypothetical protein [Symbiobacteriaceae bacterium]
MRLAVASPTSSRRLWLLGGIILALVLHLLQVPLRFAIHPSLAYVGLTQWLYLGPAALLARQTGRRLLMLGLVAGGVLTALLNAGAWVAAYFIYFVGR